MMEESVRANWDNEHGHSSRSNACHKKTQHRQDICMYVYSFWESKINISNRNLIQMSPKTDSLPLSVQE